jgi:hypothetical protein
MRFEERSTTTAPHLRLTLQRLDVLVHALNLQDAGNTALGQH